VAENVSSSKSRVGYSGVNTVDVVALNTVDCAQETRMSTGCRELDRVLGGGLVQGSVVLLGGDPGIGKSTLLLSTLMQLSETQPVLYVTGEESVQQISLRAKRMDVQACEIALLANTQVEGIIEKARQIRPKVMVIDSIQTLFSESLAAAPGSVSQVRETAARLVAFAKQSNVALFLVGHVTKDGALAGPRVLEHMVDCVLYFEGGSSSRYRILRAIKNRFGAVNELGVFAMTETGLREVANPSAIFLASATKAAPGSVTSAVWEGSRPMLVEIQALVDQTAIGNPRRLCVGFDGNRLAMLLAILSKHSHVVVHDQDVYMNVVGGLKVTETAVDLAVVAATLSSLKDKVIARQTLFFGEMGLSGEIRPVSHGVERVNEAIKQGFHTIVLPKANAPKQTPKGVKLVALTHLSQLSSEIFS